MAAIDSAASFKQRCHSLSGDDALFDSLKAQGVTTSRQMAFCAGSPNQPPTDDAVKNLAEKVYATPAGASATIGQVANMRMLLFESATLVTAHLKAQATADDADVTGRKLPHVEKQARLVEQRKRLVGVLVEGETQPSYALVDMCQLISESNSITWISPAKCTKRDVEVQMLGKEKTSLVQAETGALRLSTTAKVPEAEHASAIHLMYCLIRRGLALDQCSLIPWKDHDLYTQTLMSYLNTDPAAGMSRVSVTQVIRADKEVWTIMSREVQPPVNGKGTSGTPVMAEALARLVNDPRVVVHLVALPLHGSSASSDKAVPSQLNSAIPRPGVKAKAKAGKRKRASSMIPESLKGCACRIKEGPVCWGFNCDEGCSLDTQPGKPAPRCVKGFYVCAYCHKAGHSFPHCRQRGK